MDWDTKTSLWHCPYSPPRGCGVFTFAWLTRHACDLDELDHAHRLLKTEVPIELIAEATGLPLESIIYIKERNDYADPETE